VKDSTGPGADGSSSTDVWAARLDRLGSHIKTRLEQTRFTINSADELDVSRTSKSLLQLIVSQAAAVRHLIRTENSGAAGPNVRTLLEVTLELQYLLEHGDRAANARRMMIFALREWGALLKELGDDPEIATEIQDVDHRLAVYAERDPSGIESIAKLRWGHHWSGQSRTQMMKRVDDAVPENPGAFLRLYRALSWETHGTTACVVNVREVIVDGELVQRHAYPISPEGASANYAEYATRILTHAWETFCRAFDLSPWLDISKTDAHPAQHEGQ
jgi:hypothetical protein